MTDNVRDAVIVGGGIVGCLTAFLLAREGLKVTLLEADSVGSHASGFAFGEMGALEGAGIPNPLLAFSVWSLQRHHRLSQELKEASGVDNQFQFTNRLSLAFDENSVDALKSNLAWQQKVKAFTVSWLEPEEVVKVEPMPARLPWAVSTSRMPHRLNPTATHWLRPNPQRSLAWRFCSAGSPGFSRKEEGAPG